MVYALVVVVLTHWPQLTLPAQAISRPDLLVHVVVFGGWALLLARSGWFGRWWTGRNLVWSWVVALAYAGLDEWTQAIPAIKRWAMWDDFAANVIGVSSGMAAAAVLAVLEGELDGRSDERG